MIEDENDGCGKDADCTVLPVSSAVNGRRTPQSMCGGKTG